MSSSSIAIVLCAQRQVRVRRRTGGRRHCRRTNSLTGRAQKIGSASWKCRSLRELAWWPVWTASADSPRASQLDEGEFSTARGASGTVMRHFVHTRVFAPPAPVAALALGVTAPATSRVLIPASRRAQRFTPSGAAATCSAIALAPVAARAVEHLAPASGTQKQSGIVHCSPRRGGLDDPRLPGNTALGAVRQCGSGRSLGRDRQVDVVRGCAGLPDHCNLTPTAERRHHTGAPRRHLLIGNIGSGGRQR